MICLSADVGGTFTDLVLIDSKSGRCDIDKVPTTPGSAAAIGKGIQRILALRALADVQVFVHGFTIATNAFLTRTGAKLVLLTTAGFRDVLEIGTQQRAQLYSLTERRAAPVISRSHVVELAERIDAFGNVVEPLTPQSIEAAVSTTAALAPDAIAVSLLFGHLNPAHERAVRDALRLRLPGVPVYLASEVNPQVEEYARCSTTAIAAYVGPEVRRYLGSLEAELRRIGLQAPMLLMRSDGGVASVPAMLENPGHSLFSGPAGCVIGGTQIARELGLSDLVTFDMGGTTADFSVVAGGETLSRTGRSIDGLPLRLPSLDVESISAGGGSIAHVDLGGALKVGPRSAGAVPGPACYGKGGTEPTVTDAALVLGILDAGDYLGGELPLFADRACEAIERAVAGPLGLSVEEAAFGIMAVANAQMCQAIRTLSVERGLDLRRFALLACGGAGPAHAPYMARELEMGEVIVPVHPGVFAAQGLLGTDLRHSAQRPWQSRLADADPGALAACLGELRAGLDRALARDRVSPTDRAFRYWADVRCVGQFHELNVPLAAPEGTHWWRWQQVHADFHDLHHRIYGHADREAPAEIVNLRVEAFGRMPKAAVAPATTGERAGPRTRSVGTRRVYLDREHGFVACDVHRRDELHCGDRIPGPAIIAQRDSTVLVLAAQAATVTASGVIRIDVRAGSP